MTNFGNVKGKSYNETFSGIYTFRTANRTTQNSGLPGFWFQSHNKNKIMVFIYLPPSIVILQSNIFMLL